MLMFTNVDVDGLASIWFEVYMVHGAFGFIILICLKSCTFSFLLLVSFGSVGISLHIFCTIPSTYMCQRG